VTAEVALAFIGTVVPDEPRYKSSAFHRGGNNVQFQLIRGLGREGMSDIEILSARPIPSFPRSSTVWVPARWERLDDFSVRLIPFVNVTPLKQLLIGLEVLFCLIQWGWRKRSARHRLVLTYNLAVPPGLFTLLGARIARAKAVVSVNDINIPGETVPSSALWRIDMHLQRWLLPRFDGYLAVAKEIAEDFFPGRQFARVEGGVDQTFFERTARTVETATTLRDSFVIVSAGWLNKANGIPVMLAAFDALQSPGVRLRIAGSGPLQGVVEEAAQRDSRIDYLGSLDSEGVAELYRTADVLLNIRLTRVIDTRYFFPGKLIEYLASGVPTITTSVAHVEQEYVGLVYLLREESAEALAELLSLVRSKPLEERVALGQRARAYAAANLTWEAQAAKVAKYLREVVLMAGPPEGQGHGASER
jgi:glycosyltransferase involved in cell wall biosynthesis